MSFSAKQLDGILETMAVSLQELLVARSVNQPAMVGIHTGGAWVAAELHRRLGLDTPMGTLDISFYRDDFHRRGLHPQVRRTTLPFEVEDRHLILVDDVLMSGRTVRAALNELFDFGRPCSVVLATLFDVGRRELPICPDICGETLALTPQQRIELRGPSPLCADITETEIR